MLMGSNCKIPNDCMTFDPDLWTFILLFALCTSPFDFWPYHVIITPPGQPINFMNSIHKKLKIRITLGDEYSMFKGMGFSGLVLPTKMMEKILKNSWGS